MEGLKRCSVRDGGGNVSVLSIRQKKRWQWTVFLLGWMVTATPASANCSDRSGSLEWYEPAMSQHLQQLQSQQDPLWGSEPVFDRIEGRQILLTSRFDALSGAQKTAAINAVTTLDFRDYLTPESYEQKFVPPGNEGIGTFPYNVIASDGRGVSVVYDGCTRFELLTERDRFDYYFNRQFGSYTSSSEGLIRNAGEPDWRQVNFSIEPAAEKAVRLGFWNSVGYDSEDWWIAWVPELGNFEVNVPENFNYAKLQRYWEVADPSYRYIVVREDGTRLGEKQFP